jgi:2-dehydropantoate 2-reductase
MRTLQIEEGVVPGAISVYRFVRLPLVVQHLMLFVLGRKYAKIRTSMLQDVERGAKTEVDQIHGAIVAAAKQAGVEVPLTAQIVTLIHAIEQGKAKPSLAAIDQIARSVE